MINWDKLFEAGKKKQDLFDWKDKILIWKFYKHQSIEINGSKR